MTKRRKDYVKARNIVNNNLQKQRFVVKVTAKTAHLIVKAYNLYQKQAQERRVKIMSLIAAYNETIAAARAAS